METLHPFQQSIDSGLVSSLYKYYLTVVFLTVIIVPHFRVYFIFTSQGIVISYLFTITLQQSLLTVGLPVDYFHTHHMEPITDDLNMFFLEMDSEYCVSTEFRLKIKIVLIGWQTITIIRHEHLQARLLTFVKVLCRGMISLYYLEV